jgi:hypothetical protein
MLLTDKNSFDLEAVSKGPYRGEPFGVHIQVISKQTHTHTHTHTHIYIYIYSVSCDELDIIIDVCTT